MSPEYERLIGRAVMDGEFREQLISDPEGAVKAAGFDLSDAEMEHLKGQIEQYNNAGRPGLPGGPGGPGGPGNMVW